MTSGIRAAVAGAWLLASCAGSPAPVPKDPATIPHFAARTIEVPEPVRTVLFHDVDGDPPDDLVVLTDSEALVLRERGDSRQELPLAKGWTHVQLERAPTGKGNDLFVFSPAGVDRLALAAARIRSERIVEAAFPAEGPPDPTDWRLFLPGAFRSGRWALDVDGDGWIDVLVPGGLDAGFDVFGGGPAGWRRRGRSNVPGKRPSPAWIPDLFPCDYDGDGRPDLVAQTPEGLWFLPAGAERPAARLAFEAPGSRASATDLDGDGLPDFVVADPAGDRYLVHRGRPGGPPPAEADALHEPEGDHHFGPYLADGDGDGITDLAWLELDEPGLLRAGLGVLVADEIPLDVEVVTIGSRGTRRESFTAHVDRSLLEGDELAALASGARALGDLDGDGRLDLVVLNDDDDLAILYDVEGGAAGPAPGGGAPLAALVARMVYGTLDAAARLPGRAPDRTIDVPPAFEPDAVRVETGDLDGDGHDDLLLYERGRATKVVLLASGGTKAP